MSQEVPKTPETPDVPDTFDPLTIASGIVDGISNSVKGIGDSMSNTMDDLVNAGTDVSAFMFKKMKDYKEQKKSKQNSQDTQSSSPDTKQKVDPQERKKQREINVIGSIQESYDEAPDKLVWLNSPQNQKWLTRVVNYTGRVPDTATGRLTFAQTIDSAQFNLASLAKGATDFAAKKMEQKKGTPAKSMDVKQVVKNKKENSEFSDFTKVLEALYKLLTKLLEKLDTKESNKAASEKTTEDEKKKTEKEISLQIDQERENGKTQEKMLAETNASLNKSKEEAKVLKGTGEGSIAAVKRDMDAIDSRKDDLREEGKDLDKMKNDLTAKVQGMEKRLNQLDNVIIPNLETRQSVLSREMDAGKQLSQKELLELAGLTPTLSDLLIQQFGEEISKQFGVAKCETQKDGTYVVYVNKEGLLNVVAEEGKITEAQLEDPKWVETARQKLREAIDGKTEVKSKKSAPETVVPLSEIPEKMNVEQQRDFYLKMQEGYDKDLATAKQAKGANFSIETFNSEWLKVNNPSLEKVAGLTFNTLGSEETQEMANAAKNLTEQMKEEAATNFETINNALFQNQELVSVSGIGYSSSEVSDFQLAKVDSAKFIEALKATKEVSGLPDAITLNIVKNAKENGYRDNGSYLELDVSYADITNPKALKERFTNFAMVQENIRKNLNTALGSKLQVLTRDIIGGKDAKLIREAKEGFEAAAENELLLGEVKITTKQLNAWIKNNTSDPLIQRAITYTPNGLEVNDSVVQKNKTEKNMEIFEETLADARNKISILFKKMRASITKKVQKGEGDAQRLTDFLQLINRPGGINDLLTKSENSEYTPQVRMAYIENAMEKLSGGSADSNVDFLVTARQALEKLEGSPV